MMSANANKKAGETSGSEVNNQFGSCRDLSDVQPLFSPRGLYLKPIAKVNVSVNLPQLKTPGKTISTWEVMEKIRRFIIPDEFVTLKVVKSSLEFIRLEGDLRDRSRLQRVLSRLDSQRLSLAGFPNALKVRAAEAKEDFPTKHSWNSYFRDAKHMNELKPGERPDTVHITGVPVKWFAEDGCSVPSEAVVKKVFSRYGGIRRIDIPAADPYRPRMRLGNNIKKFSFEDGLFFDVFIQYMEYMDFVKCMDALKGMQLLKKEEKSSLTASIKVDFDKTKHMSDSTVTHRDSERRRLIATDSLAAEKLRKKEEAERKEKEDKRKKEVASMTQRQGRRKKREEKRKRKALTVLRKQEEDKVSMKIAREERKLIKAQRQLESIRLLDELFDRIKIKVESKEIPLESTDKKVDNNDASKTNAEEDKKKEKKLKRKKSKKEKKKKKSKKNKKSDSDSSSSDSDSDSKKKRLQSAVYASSSGAPGFPYPMYPRMGPAWYPEPQMPMLYPMRGMRGRGRGRGRGFWNSDGQFGRGRGGFWGHHNDAGFMYEPHSYNDQYLKYFSNLTGQPYRNEHDGRNSRSRSRSRKRSRNSYSRSRSRNRSRSGRNSRSRSRSRSRSYSRSRSRDRSRSGRHSRSRSRSRNRSRSRRRSYENRNGSSKRRNYRRSLSKTRVTRAKSRTVSPKRRSRSSSWSLPKSARSRSRSCSWEKQSKEKKSNDSEKKSEASAKNVEKMNEKEETNVKEKTNDKEKTIETEKDKEKESVAE